MREEISSTSVPSWDRIGLILPSTLLRKLLREINCSFTCGVGCHSCDVSTSGLAPGEKLENNVSVVLDSLVSLGGLSANLTYGLGSTGISCNVQCRLTFTFSLYIEVSTPKVDTFLTQRLIRADGREGGFTSKPFEKITLRDILGICSSKTSLRERGLGESLFP